jgi:lysophospholipase L1-like esterase
MSRREPWIFLRIGSPETGEETVKRYRWLAGMVAAMAMCAGLSAVASGTAGAAAIPGPHYYLALGGSDSVGFQPTVTIPHGQRTDDGYADDLLSLERARWSDLGLVQLGCPGESTLTMLTGGDRCYPSLSQLALAVSFLKQHPSTVLVTVDVGFNDVVRCIIHRVIDASCVDVALESVRDQLPQILAALRSAGGPELRIIGVGHYDPYLAAYLSGPIGRSFATQSLDVMTRLNETLRSVYAAAGIPMADVATAFDMSGVEPTKLPNGAVVPMNVARTCALTWECVTSPLGHNKHPNEEGYRLIGEAISDLVSNT